MSQLHLERLRLQVWDHLLTLLASYSMFGLLKGSMSFGGTVFWRMVFEIFGHGLLLFSSKGIMLHNTRPS
jgi:hypothetical protein